MMARHSGRRSAILVTVLLSTTVLACRGCGLGSSTSREPEPLVAEDWSVDWIEQQSEIGEYDGGLSVAIAVDDNGCPHVAYGGTQARYASRRGGTWEVHPFGEPARYAGGFSVALDKMGGAYIAYDADVENYRVEVRYATTEAGTAPEETTMSSGRHMGAPYLGLLPSDDPVLTYWREGQLLFAKHDDGDWHVEVVASDLFARSTRVMVDPSGTVWLLFAGRAYGDITLYAAHSDSNQWEFEELYETWGESVHLEIALALDGQGQPRIAFVDSEQRRLVYGTRQSGGWSLEEVADEPERQLYPAHPAIAVGPDSRVYICYTSFDSQTRELTLAWLAGENWHHTVVEEHEHIASCAIAIGDDGGIHLAYSRGNGYQVRYAYHPPLE
jgi:hypothetical protein